MVDGGEEAAAVAPWGPAFDPQLRDRLAASVINAKLPYMYSTSAVGFIRAATELGEYYTPLTPAVARGLIASLEAQNSHLQDETANLDNG